MASLLVGIGRATIVRIIVVVVVTQEGHRKAAVVFVVAGMVVAIPVIGFVVAFPKPMVDTAPLGTVRTGIDAIGIPVGSSVVPATRGTGWDGSSVQRRMDAHGWCQR